MTSPVVRDSFIVYGTAAGVIKKRSITTGAMLGETRLPGRVIMGPPASAGDTIVFSLFYFNGVKGQRAIVLLSDGKDEGSRFGWDEALDYARRAGVAIYPIGLGEDLEKRKLERLAEETGGRAFFLKDAGELDAIYSKVQEELRSKYLIAYQSTNTSGSDDFRAVELKVSRPGVEIKTIRGYYP